MDALETIFTRRSIRKYTGKIIKDEDLMTILKAASYAPSAHNRQPLEFIVVKDKDLLKIISQNHPYAKMLVEAGCGVIVCGDNKLQNSIGFLIQDCAAAIENMLLAAHCINLGAVWCGLYPIEELISMVKDNLNLPDNIVPIGLVVIGEKAIEVKAVDRFDKSKIHYEKW